VSWGAQCRLSLNRANTHRGSHNWTCLDVHFLHPGRFKSGSGLGSGLGLGFKGLGFKGLGLGIWVFLVPSRASLSGNDGTADVKVEAIAFRC